MFLSVSRQQKFWHTEPWPNPAKIVDSDPDTWFRLWAVPLQNIVVPENIYKQQNMGCLGITFVF